ncbi:Rho-N domain-containing protein 1, partial [Clarias magur]
MLGVPLGAKLWGQTMEIKIYFLFGKEGTSHYFQFCQGDKTELSGYNENHLGLGRCSDVPPQPMHPQCQSQVSFDNFTTYSTAWTERGFRYAALIKTWLERGEETPMN